MSLSSLYTFRPSIADITMATNVTFALLPPEMELFGVTSSSLKSRAGGGTSYPAQYSATWELLLQAVIVPSLCGVGIIGNALNIFVLTRQRMRRSVRLPDKAVHVGLVGLAVSDMIVCLLTLPRAFLPEYKLVFDASTEVLSLHYQIYSTGLITTFNLISTWLIVATAGTRYIATFHPLQSALEPDHCGRAGCRGVLGRQGSLLVVLIIYVACAVGNLPSFFLFRAIPVALLETGNTPIVFDSNGNDLREDSETIIVTSLLPSPEPHILKGPVPSSAPHPFLEPFPVEDLAATHFLTTHDANGDLMYIDLGAFSHDTQPGAVFHWIKSACSIFLPGILLMFFNIRLIQALRHSERLRHRPGSSTVAPPIDGLSMSTNSRSVASRNRLNVTLVAVVVMFVCLVYPCELLDFFVHLIPSNSMTVDREAMMLARMFLNALQLSNFALNFFLYCTVNAQFRRALVDWFCRRSRFQRNSQNYRRTFHATPAKPNVRMFLGNDELRMTQIRGVGGVASGGSHSAVDPDKHVGIIHSNSGRCGQKRSGSRSSHSNGRRS